MRIDEIKLVPKLLSHPREVPKNQVCTDAKHLHIPEILTLLLFPLAVTIKPNVSIIKMIKVIHTNSEKE